MCHSNAGAFTGKVSLLSYDTSAVSGRLSLVKGRYVYDGDTISSNLATRDRIAAHPHSNPSRNAVAGTATSFHAITPGAISSRMNYSPFADTRSCSCMRNDMVSYVSHVLLSMSYCHETREAPSPNRKTPRCSREVRGQMCLATMSYVSEVQHEIRCTRSKTCQIHKCQCYDGKAHGRKSISWGWLEVVLGHFSMIGQNAIQRGRIGSTPSIRYTGLAFRPAPVC